MLSSMGTIYTAEVERKEEHFVFSEALKEQAIGFVNALKEAVVNVFKPVPTAFEVEEKEGDSLRSLIAQSISPASALAFMVFLLLYTSCLGTVAVMWKEAGKGFALTFLAYSLLLGWLFGFFAYRIGSVIWNT